LKKEIAQESYKMDVENGMTITTAYIPITVSPIEFL